MLLQLVIVWLISHFLGPPIVAFGLRIDNKTRKPIEVTDLNLDVIASDESSHALMLGAASRSETTEYASPTWRVQPDEPFDYYLWWAPLPWQQLGIAVTQEIMMLPEYSSPPKNPCTNSEPLSEGAIKKLNSSFNDAFIWAPGSWTFALAGKIDGARFEKKWAVTLNQPEVDRMKAIIAHYRECWAVNLQSFIVDSGSIVTFVHKNVTAN
jgi:hypothetical protein